MGILGTGICIPDEVLASALQLDDCAIDLAILPPMMRRRTSLATRMAVSAAGRACAGDARDLQIPAIFVSAAGEMQVTDRLCRAIAREAFPLSPTQFHNSVHNSASAYWSMATGSHAPMQAMSAQQDCFAMGLLEASCQLQWQTERLLLVVYDEPMPAELLPGFDWQACAFALLLGMPSKGLPLVSRPFVSNEVEAANEPASLSSRTPAMAGLPLLQALRNPVAGRQCLPVTTGDDGWTVELELP
jgi:hypothetical protein